VCVLRHGMPSSTAQGGGRNPEARREGPAGHRRYDHRIELGIGRILMDETQKAAERRGTVYDQNAGVIGAEDVRKEERCRQYRT